jgi:hypothetical protein
MKSPLPVKLLHRDRQRDRQTEMERSGAFGAAKKDFVVLVPVFQEKANVL